MLKICTTAFLSGLFMLYGNTNTNNKPKLTESELLFIKNQLKKEIIEDLRNSGYSITKTAGEEEEIRGEQGSYRVSESQTASQEKEAWDDANKDSDGKPVTKKGFIQIPGTSSNIRPYGFANITCAYTRHQNASGYTSDMSIFPANVAFDDEGRKKRYDYNFLASDSRLGFETYSIAKINGNEYPLKTLFEFDFSDGDDSSRTITSKYKLKIRHAYMTIGNFLAGMTTSAFVDYAAAAEINGPGVTGSTTKRVPQLSYTQDCGNVEIRYSLERVLTSYCYAKMSDGNLSINSKDSYAAKNNLDDDNKYHSSDILPSAVVALKLKNENYHIGLAGVLRYLKISSNTHYDNNLNVNVPSKTVTSLGYGARVSGSYKFANNDSLFGAFTFGTGIGVYLADADKYSNYVSGIGEGLDMNPVDAYGLNFGYRHFWSEKYRMRSTLVFGFTHLNHSQKLLSKLNSSKNYVDLNKNLFTANVNLLFDITKKFTCGFEFCHSMRKLTDGRSGSSQILMFTSSISF